MLSRRTFVSVLVAATAVRVRAGAAVTATVRIGSVPVDNYAQPYFGDGTGIFRDAGIAVEISALANS